MFKKLTTTIAASALVATIGLGTMQPAKADGAASTRNIILGAAAVVAGIAIENNVAHKNAQANTVQGYLPGGGTVYGDGHVALPNGQTYYPGNYGEQVSCNGQSCYTSGGNGNDPYVGYNNGYNNGNGWNNGYNNGYNGQYDNGRVSWNNGRHNGWFHR